MIFTDLEKDLLRGASIDIHSKNLTIKDLDYDNLDLKDLSQIQKTTADYMEWIDNSQVERWKVQMPVDFDRNEHCLLLATSFIKAFVLVNYIESKEELDKSFEAFLESMEIPFNLELDGEGVIQNISFPKLIAVASQLLDFIDAEKCPSSLWWKIRCAFLHQKFLEEKSPLLFTKIKEYARNEIFQTALSNHRDLKALFHCEMASIHLFYYEITAAKEEITNAEEANELSIETVGAMGKRTRYQQTALPQLLLKISHVGEQSKCYDFNKLPLNSNPQSCKLDDDTRLDQIKLEEGVNDLFDRDSLTPLNYVCIFAKFIHYKISQPKDGMLNEELGAFMPVLTDEPLSWCIKMSSLYYRSILESNHRRTVERSLEQLRAVKKELIDSSLSQAIRYQHFFASRLPTACEIEITLADILVSLGSTKEALEIYLKFNIYEKAVACYHRLSLRHKAEELILDELEKNDSVKLWILLGDSTDDTMHYKKAWELSNNRSGRAQRQWGYYHFNKKEYNAAIDHFSKSLELNGLEYEVWFSYGYALMETKNWETCVKAYLQCVNMNYDNFEAWNNLAVAYRNLGKKEKALNALLTAAKCDYDVWKVWENILTLAMECNAICDVMAAYHRLLELKSNKFVDITALYYIAHSIMTSKVDYKGQQCRTLKQDALKLLGKITAAETGNGTVWSIYSDLLISRDPNDTDGQITEEMYYRSIQCAEKSVRLLMLESTWYQIVKDAQKVTMGAKAFLTKVEEFCELYPHSRKDWYMRVKYLICNIKDSLEASMKRMVEIPKEFIEMKQEMEAGEERVVLLNSS